MHTEPITSLHPRTENLLDRTFTRLTVIAFAGYTSTRQAQWICECIEGNIVKCFALNLKNGNSQSCGCLKREKTSIAHTTHGKRACPEYQIWNTMIQRCTNPNQKSYADYGGRGITACNAWTQSFETFFADMGPRPSPKHMIERRNNTQGYQPDNCLWETRITQNRNKRNNTPVTFENRTQCIAAWAEETGIPAATILYRLTHKWSIKDALTMSVSLSNKPHHRDS